MTDITKMSCLISTQDDFQARRKSSELIYLFINTISVINYGLAQFHSKYLKIYYPNDYELYSLILWRSIAVMTLSYLIIQYKREKILDVRKIQNKFWFIIRTFGQFFAIQTYLFILEYFRASTASCFVTMNPVMVVILSTYILKEKFYFRYIIGIILCFSGVLLMVYNEKGQVQADHRSPATFLILAKGFFWGVAQLTIVAMTRVASKILNSENIDEDNQCFYLGLTNVLCALIGNLLIKRLTLTWRFVLHGLFNGVFVLIATMCMIISLKGVDLNKTTALNYLTMITVFVLGVLILNEPVFVSDLLGSLIILAYNLFNISYPPK